MVSIFFALRRREAATIVFNSNDMTDGKESNTQKDHGEAKGNQRQPND